MQGKEKAAVNPDTVTSEAQLQKELDKKAQELLEEKEADSRMRTYIGPMSKILVVLLCVWTVFQLYFTTLGAISAINLRAFHCIFLLLFTFLLFPTYKKEKRVRNLPPVWDMLLILLGAGLPDYEFHPHCPDGGTGGFL